MTLKDKVKQMRPQDVREYYIGEVYKCPNQYEFLHCKEGLRDNCTFGLKQRDDEKCTECWNRDYVPTLEELRKLPLTINDYQKEALRTEPDAAKITKLTRLANGLMGLNGEAGEAVDILKKHLFQGHELDEEHLAKELGDVAWYLAVTADAIGYDLEKIFRVNIEKLRARYPDGFDTEKSINRQKNDI